MVAAAAITDDVVVCNVEVTDGGRASVLEFMGVMVVNTVMIDVGVADPLIAADPLNAVDREVAMTVKLTIRDQGKQVNCLEWEMSKGYREFLRRCSYKHLPIVSLCFRRLYMS